MDDSASNYAVPMLTNKNDNSDQLVSFSRKVWEENKMVWYITGPCILSAIFQFSLAFTTQTWVGHVGTLELAAFGLQNLVISGLSCGIMLGMGSALETSCGQAYGAGKLTILGIYLQSSWVILLGTALPLTPILVFATPILLVLGQKEEIAELAGTYSIWMIPQ
ncbi:hypothetical protein MKX03_031146 [Papaver bracteatum]|nr:hypothetical protein MKX03_031146 [Papaver bracteatum]